VPNTFNTESQSMIYVAHYNYDYDESMSSGRDLRAILENIRDAFGVDAEVTDSDFADEVDESYAGGGWKGFTIHALDPETGAHLAIDLSKASKAVVSNHTMVEFQGRLEASFEKIRRQHAA
jgi:hypothetical protein|tara:strand:+ start:381 stop:743 length:363 start_codon:yes stop_codon:yes gene_type:complete